MSKINPKHKLVLAYASFVAGIIAGFVGIFCEPIGEISNTILVFIGQLLVFCSTLIGLNIHLGKYGSTTAQNNIE